MKLFKKSQIVKHKKDGRINPNRFWLFFVTGFLIVFIIVILGFTYFFVVISKRLDTAVVPRLQTNSNQILKIEEVLKKTEGAVLLRQGMVPASETQGN